jgi:hypothetical protein
MHLQNRIRIVSLAFALSLLPFANCFSFSYTAPLSCKPLNIEWTGGTPPFTLIVTPAFDAPVTYNIPNDNFNGTRGSFVVPQLSMNATEQFMLTMSDATAFASGGNSAILSVGGPQGDCNTAPYNVDFNYEINSALQQCRVFRIDSFPPNKQITMTGLIPLGQAFQIQFPLGATSFDWTANVKGGTRMIIYLTDSDGKMGGSSDILSVLSSDETSCINDQSPHSLGTGPTSAGSGGDGSGTGTGTGTSTPTQTPTTTPGPATGSNTGVIAGAAAGVIVLILALSSMVVFLIRRRRDANGSSPFGSSRKSRRLNSVELFADPSSGHPGYPRQEFMPTPFVVPQHSQQQQQHYQQQQRPESDYENSSTFDGSIAMSPYTRSPYESQPLRDQRLYGAPATTPATGEMSKSQMAAAYAAAGQREAPRFVLHTDAGALESTENLPAEGVVELPPTYTDVSTSSVSRSSPSHTPPAPEPAPAPAPGGAYGYQSHDEFQFSGPSSSSGPSRSNDGIPQLPPLGFGR